MSISSTVFLAVIATLICFTVADGTLADSCCKRKSIPLKCHFLCGSGSTGFFTRWTCRTKYYASIKTCQVNDAIDYVKLFGQKLTTSVAKGFESLLDSIKSKLMDASRFFTLTVAELMQIPQDVLGSLQEGLEHMTSTQLSGISRRLKYFTRQNLHNVLSRVPVDSFRNSLVALNIDAYYDMDQFREFALAGLRTFGKHVGNWTKEALDEMNQLLLGLESSEILEIAGVALRGAQNILCKVPFSTDQKNAFLVPAKKAFKEIADWDDATIRKICFVVEIFPPSEILKLSAKVVGETASVLSKNKYFVPQTRALVKKVKTAWGQVDKWDEVKIKNLGQLLQGIDKKDIYMFLGDTIKKTFNVVGKITWDEGKAREWVKKAKLVLGNPEMWNIENLRNLGYATVALLPSELQQIGNATLYNSLKYIKNVHLHLDQALIVVDKVKSIKKLEDINKDDLVAMQGVLDGFLSSDIGKLSTLVVTAAFPEIILVTKVGLPIARAFIHHYEKSQGDGKIGVLNGFATYLTRKELNETNIKNIVGDLERLGVIDWDASQVIELMQRIKREWGSFNETDGYDSDEPVWGFGNFKKLGKIVVGLAKEDLRQLPIRGIEDILEVLGANKDWSRGQIVAGMQRIREYWEVNNLHLSNLTETDIKALGEFVSGLAVSELKKLPKSSLHIAIRYLGQKTDLPEDKLRSLAYAAIQLIKNETGKDLISGNHVVELGSLLKGANRAVLKKITKTGFLDNLYQITRIKNMSDDRLWQVIELAKQHFGRSDVKKWLPDEWYDLGPAIKMLLPRELRRISSDALKENLEQLGAFDIFTVEQAQALIEAAKEHWKKWNVAEWTGEELRKLGSLVKGLSANEILSLSAQHFEEAIGVWGQRQDIPYEHLKTLAQKAKTVFLQSSGAELTADGLKILGRIVLGMTPNDLENIKIDNVDTVAALGAWKDWKREQLATLQRKIREFLSLRNDSESYIYLGYLAKMLTRNDIKLLDPKAFEYSVKHFAQLNEWSSDQLDALAEKAKLYWGAPNLWGKAQVSEIGRIIRGLKVADLKKLQISTVDAIKPEIMNELNIEQLKAFTPEQFRSMDSSQLNMISEDNVRFLSAAQRYAINEVKTDDPLEQNPWPQESCSVPGCPVSRGQLLLSNILILVAPFVLYLSRN